MMRFEIKMNNRNLHIEAVTLEEAMSYLPAGVEYGYNVVADFGWNVVYLTLTRNYNYDTLGEGWDTLEDDIIWGLIDSYDDTMNEIRCDDYWWEFNQYLEEVDSFFGA